MNFKPTLEDYYRRFVDLQEKLKKSEEQRFVLEKKFNDMVLVAKEEEQMHYKKLRSQYKRFLEEDRKRQCRNEQIIRNLERIETRISTLSAKTERIDDLRKQYQIYLQRMSDHQSRSKTIPPIRRSPSRDRRVYQPNKSTQTIDIQCSLLDRPSMASKPDVDDSHYQKLEILDHYLHNLSSQRYKDEVLREDNPSWSKDYHVGASNQATVIADDIMNSIYSRYYNKSELLPNTSKPEEVSGKTEPEKVLDDAEFLLRSKNLDPVNHKQMPDETPDNEKVSVDVASTETPEKASFKLMDSPRGLFDDTQSRLSDDQLYPDMINDQESPNIDQSHIDVPVKEEIIEPTDESPNHQEETQDPVEEPPSSSEDVIGAPEIEAPLPQPDEQPDIRNDQPPSLLDQQPQVDDNQEVSSKPTPTDHDQNYPEQLLFEKDEDTKHATVEDEPVNVGDTTSPDKTDEQNIEPSAPQTCYDETNQQMVYEQGDMDYEQPEQFAQYDDQNVVYDQEQPMQYEQQGQPVQYDENGQLLDQYNQYEQQVFYDQNGQMVQPHFDESGQMIPQYDENGQILVLYDQNGQQYFGEQYDQTQQPYYDYTDQEQAQFNDGHYDQYPTDEPQPPDDGTPQNVNEIPVQPEETEPTNPEEEVKIANVMEMLDTDTESVKQNASKISNESDFDFS